MSKWLDKNISSVCIWSFGSSHGLYGISPRYFSKSIVITTSNAAGEEVKVRIDAILCVAHHNIDAGIRNASVVPQAKKIFRNGQLYILVNGKTYTVTGSEVK